MTLGRVMRSAVAIHRGEDAEREFLQGRPAGFNTIEEQTRLRTDERSIW
jgi:hypothetical protein